MNMKNSVDKILEVLAFKKRQKQFCEFIDAVDNGDVLQVEKMLRKNPKLVSVQCISPKGCVSIPSWLKIANPLAIALVPTLGSPSENHIKIVDCLIKNGANPLSNNDNNSLSTVLETFLIHVLHNAPQRFDDCLSVERIMCNQLLIKVEQDYVLQNVLQDIPVWRWVEKNNPQLSDKIIQDVYAVKAKNSKQNIEQQLDVTSSYVSHRRKM